MSIHPFVSGFFHIANLWDHGATESKGHMRGTLGVQQAIRSEQRNFLSYLGV